MARLGECIDTQQFIVDIDDVGGAVGTWNGAAGTFTVQLEANPNCGGGGAALQYSIATLIINGSGNLTISVSGTGGTYSTVQNTAEASVGADIKVRYTSPEGGTASCLGGPLVEETDIGTFPVCACETLALSFFNVEPPTPHDLTGNWSCTFTITAS